MPWSFRWSLNRKEKICSVCLRSQRKTSKRKHSTNRLCLDHLSLGIWGVVYWRRLGCFLVGAMAENQGERCDGVGERDER